MHQNIGPKYEQVQHAIQELLKDDTFLENGFIPSESKLCEQFGVSRKTVRRSLAELKKEGVLVTSEGKGVFVPQRTFSKKGSISRIGIIFPEVINADFEAGLFNSSSFYGGIFSAVLEKSILISRSLTTVPLTQGNTNSVISQCLSEGWAGLILLAVENDDFFTKLIDARIPFIAVDYWNSQIQIEAINVDAADGTRQAITYLTELGHTDIGFIIRRSRFRVDDWFEGYCSALQNAGLKFHKEWLVKCKDNEKAGHYAMCMLLKKKKLPTAIVTTSDSIARGAMKAAVEKGLSLPRDLSFTGIGDYRLEPSDQIPSLTTLSVEHHKIGCMAMERLLEIMKHPLSMQHVNHLIPAKLIIRDSCARPGRT